MNKRFLCVHTCAELEVQLVSHELGFNLVIMEGWEEGLHKRTPTKPVNIRSITDIFPSFHTQSFFLVCPVQTFATCSPHLSMAVYDFAYFCLVLTWLLTIEAQQLL